MRPKKFAKDLSRDVEFVNHALMEFCKKKFYLIIVLFYGLLHQSEKSIIFTKLINYLKKIKKQTQLEL